MVKPDKSATDVIPEVLHIGKLLDNLAEGRTRIPRFQRPFVWRPDQMLDLLDSIRRRFPIGSILVWETDRKMRSHNEIGPVTVGQAPEGATSYVLDGQQRLSTMLGALRLPEGWRGDWKNGDWKWHIAYDLDANAFFHPKHDELRAHHLPVRALLGTFDFISECRRISEQAGTKAKAIIEKAEKVADIFRNYQLPVIRIKDSDLKAAVAIFARLNARGQRMTPDQMVSALTYSEEVNGGFDLAEKISSILKELSDYGFGGLDRVAVLRAILAADEKDIYDTDWTYLVDEGKPGIDLSRAVEACKAALVQAVTFLRSEGVTSDRLLPYALQVVLLAEFFRNCPEPSAAVRSELQRWFWTTSFIGWFGTFNSSQAKIAVNEMRELARGLRQRIESVRAEPALPFPSRFDARSARVRAFLLFLISLQPLDLETAEPLNAGDVLSGLGPRALRYIVARGLPDKLLSSPANRILLGASHRGQAKAALLEISQEDPDRVLESHGIPREAISLLASKQEEFLEARQSHLIERERDFMRSRQVTPPVAVEPSEPEIDTESEDD